MANQTASTSLQEAERTSFSSRESLALAHNYKPTDERAIYLFDPIEALRYE
ncbi:MAG: hypothetical protein WBQ09_11535 [Terriglobales bacterium]